MTTKLYKRAYQDECKGITHVIHFKGKLMSYENKGLSEVKKQLKANSVFSCIQTSLSNFPSEWILF